MAYLAQVVSVLDVVIEVGMAAAAAAEVFARLAHIAVGELSYWLAHCLDYLNGLFAAGFEGEAAGSVVAAQELLPEAIVASSRPVLEVASALEPVPPLPCT